MEEKVRQGYLFDFYGDLLNEHQKEIFQAYVFEDLSLGEIASEKGISRQGVSDLIHRCTKTMEEYEASLHLLERFLSIEDKVNDILKLTNCTSREYEASMKRIAALSSDILELL